MRWSMPRLFVGLLAAPLMLASATALADGPDTCLLATAKSCQYVVDPGGCEAQCTPGSFVAECDGTCSASASVSCTGGCVTDCTEKCTQNPTTFTCTDDCESTCNLGCSGSCNANDTSCTVDCQADCSNRCQVQCEPNPPTATCDVQCQASCNASCQVQANIMCHVNCTSSVELPSCQADCQAPQGALFCDGQYVDIASASKACIAYLQSQGVSVSETCSSDSSGSNCSATIGCSAAPTLGTGQDRWGMLGITGLVMGLGLAVSRRRRRA
jgi:hypothetical protein